MIEDYLRKKGVGFEVIRHEPTYTAQETAAAEHVTGYEFAKTVIVTDGEKHYMLVLPAPYQVDVAKASKVIGTKVRLASEEEMGPLFTDCDIGAAPPLGSIYQLPTFVDEHLADQDKIVFRAGSHEKTIRMAYEDYVRIEEPTVSSFARGE